ncbi:30S ribosomal protein S12 methylthiotransferase RimO [Polyangium sorediatum]|uniref:Ribosomal protein uS12 methylthiotransferase RimO n=1 Tax=Polyangium sorediatum TaxID=889274 RepID=A0ABT6NZR1_9BACT|nr:30S ribosomal protein S12 methylthiotransferase RimO [Polyangium sorediatum]MDI1433771.1 30S ribosomal protein S12 methylthiotransferase RimO [Polyangium sorediatum]
MSGKKIHFVSLGCPKNRVDSEVMLGVARRAGYDHVPAPEDAEVIVVNTCGFIGEAKKESIDAIFEMAKLKDDGHLQKLVVAGCLSQRHPTEIADEMPEVDHILGSSDMLKLEQVLTGKAERMLVGNPADWVIRASDPRTISTPGGSAYVKIAEGCNRTCSFCVIPQLRGGQRSRPVADVVAEVEQLVAAGVREVNLVSQDTIAYGRDLPADARSTLAELVRRVADVPGLHWARLFYLYPETITDELVELIAQHPRVVPYIDMPLQHAADGMLRRMRRGHGGERLRKLVTRLRSDIPDLTFRTAFIVGHPGETDEEFKDLVDFVTWAEFDRVGVFRYSDEESSRSADMPDKVTARVASNRYRKLMSLQRRIAHKKNSALIGRELEVLVEGTSDEHEFVQMGRHRGQAPDIDGQVYLSGGEARPGEIRRVRITQASDYDLVGELLDEGAEDHAPTLTVDLPKKRISLRVLQTDGRTMAT